jgi:hypothetical protein
MINYLSNAFVLSNENQIMSYLCLYFILTHPLHLTVLEAVSKEFSLFFLF